MAENNPNVPVTPPAAGAAPAVPPVPPKPGESGKIQPKKETVRINLPPKPTAAPTIKIPAPSAIHSAAPAAAAPTAVQASAPAAAPAAQKPAAPASAPAASRPSVAPSAAPARPAAPAYASGGSLDMVDKGLAIGAAVVAVAVLVRVFLLSGS